MSANLGQRWDRSLGSETGHMPRDRSRPAPEFPNQVNCDAAEKKKIPATPLLLQVALRPALVRRASRSMRERATEHRARVFDRLQHVRAACSHLAHAHVFVARHRLHVCAQVVEGAVLSWRVERRRSDGRWRRSSGDTGAARGRARVCVCVCAGCGLWKQRYGRRTA